MTTTDGNTQTLTWRDELDAALAAHEDEARRNAEATKQEEIAYREKYIAAVIEFAKELGIAGELIETGTDEKKPHLRAVPAIECDGYVFRFQSVLFDFIKDSTPREFKKLGDLNDRFVTFKLFVSKVAVEKCELRGCRYRHPMIQSASLPGHSGAVVINRTSGAGLEEFKVTLAAALRSIDHGVPLAITEHAKTVALRLLEDEAAAYREKEQREAPPVEPEPEIEEADFITPYEEVETAEPERRSRTIYEGSFEWRLLELFAEMRRVYFDYEG